MKKARNDQFFSNLEKFVNKVYPNQPQRQPYLNLKSWPSPRDEAWKFTSLGATVSQDYALFPEAETTIQLKKVKKYFLYEIDTYKVVFIDGVYSPFLSDTTHDGLDVCLMSAALS